MNSDGARSSSIPIACTLTERELMKRQEEMSTTIFHHVQEVAELPDGYAFSFEGSAEWASRLLDFILFERECCPFFTFDLHFEPEGGPVWLRLRGSPEVKDFVAAMQVAQVRVSGD